MMGSGKTTIGRELSRISGWPYYDNDELLAMHGDTAKELLEVRGVSELRQGEAEALRLGLRQTAPCIIGAPAGTILDSQLRTLLSDESIVVWLTARPRTLARRARGSAHRPWLAGDAEAWMEKTLTERASLYESIADVKVSTERRRPARVAAQVLDAVRESCA